MSTESSSSGSRTAVIVILVVGGIGLLAILVCGGAIAAFFYGMSRVGAGMEPEVEQLMIAIADGQGAPYYQQHTSAELKQVTSEAEFVKICELVRTRLGRLRSKSLTGSFVRQMNATSSTELTYDAQFEKGPATIRLVWTKTPGGPWQLTAFNVNSNLLLGDAAEAPCPHCRQAVPEGAKFCPHCGKAVDEPKAEAEVPAAEAGDNQPVDVGPSAEPTP